MNRLNRQSYGLPTPLNDVGPVGDSPLNTTKTCTKCRISYPATPEYFTRNNATDDGLHTRCKPCKQAQNRDYWNRNVEEINEKRRETYPERREQNIARHKKWRTECREKYIAGKRKWYRENREYDLAKSKKWREENRQRKAGYDRQYAKENHQRAKVYKRRWAEKQKQRLIDDPSYRSKQRKRKRLHEQQRRARKYNLPDNFSQDDWQAALDYFGHRCAVCERPLNGIFHTAAMDHWIPLGDDNCPGTVPGNIVPLCHGRDGCNNSKHTKNPNKWLKSKFGARKASLIAAKIASYFASLT